MAGSRMPAWMRPSTTQRFSSWSSPRRTTLTPNLPCGPCGSGPALRGGQGHGPHHRASRRDDRRPRPIGTDALGLSQSPLGLGLRDDHGSGRVGSRPDSSHLRGFAVFVSSERAVGRRPRSSTIRPNQRLDTTREMAPAAPSHASDTSALFFFTGSSYVLLPASIAQSALKPALQPFQSTS